MLREVVLVCREKAENERMANSKSDGNVRRRKNSGEDNMQKQCIIQGKSRDISDLFWNPVLPIIVTEAAPSELRSELS